MMEEQIMHDIAPCSRTGKLIDYDFTHFFFKKSNFSQINLLTFLMSCILHHYLVTLKIMTDAKEKVTKGVPWDMGS